MQKISELLIRFKRLFKKKEKNKWSSCEIGVYKSNQNLPEVFKIIKELDFDKFKNYFEKNKIDPNIIENEVIFHFLFNFNSV